MYIFFFINCIYCIVLIVYIVLARTCFNERFSLLNVAWLNKVLYCIVLYDLVKIIRPGSGPKSSHTVDLKEGDDVLVLTKNLMEVYDIKSGIPAPLSR